MDTLTVNAVLGPKGLVSRRIAAYEHRSQQLEMAAAVADALQSQKHLVVEAGTGVGKSYAYLVPAILYATSNEGKASPGKASPEKVGSDKLRSQKPATDEDDDPEWERVRHLREIVGTDGLADGREDGQPA